MTEMSINGISVFGTEWGMRNIDFQDKGKLLRNLV